MEILDIPCEDCLNKNICKFQEHVGINDIFPVISHEITEDSPLQISAKVTVKCQEQRPRFTEGKEVDWQSEGGIVGYSDKGIYKVYPVDALD